MSGSKTYPISKIDINDTKVELSCRTVKSLLIYFEEHYGKSRLEEFIYGTNMNFDYLTNSNNWVSFNYFCRLLAKLAEYTEDPNIAFKVGLYTTKKNCYGILETIVTRLGTPGTAYNAVTELTPRYSKLGVFKISNITRNSCRISTTYFDHIKQDKNNCLNVQGMFASIPALWDLPLAKVKEIECAAEGGKSCVYEISWRNRASHLFALCGMLAGLALVFLFEFFFATSVNGSVLLLILASGYLAGRTKDYKNTLSDKILTSERETKDLMESFQTIEKLNIDLQDTVEQRTHALRDSNKELQNTINELEKSQSQLVQSEKMASVGRLAAGMAHELNNPIGAIRNYIQDIMEDTSEEDPILGRLKGAEKATGRCKRLVNELLTFSREVKEIKSVDINDIIKSTVSSAKEEILNAGITISEELSSELPKLKLDPLQIQQVFMNVVMNAADALKDKGMIHIKTFKKDQRVFIEFYDTGQGIPDDIQDKIFDPFFTTKSTGKGKGLGLAISYDIIKRFNGDIRLKSKEHRGTSITIILPIQ